MAVRYNDAKIMPSFAHDDTMLLNDFIKLSYYFTSVYALTRLNKRRTCVWSKENDDDSIK